MDSFAIRSCSRTRTARGSTLIEVLVALLLLSFTLLGIAGLMSATTRYQLGVNSRSVITLLFNDLTSRVRSNNASAATAYIYNSATWSTQQGTISAVSPLCGATDAVVCSPDQRAAHDIWELRTAVKQSLPQGGLLVDGSPDNGLTMSFLWFDKDTTKDDGAPLRQSSPCGTGMSSVQRQTCCPAAAGVDATPGVRCLNFTFIR